MEIKLTHKKIALALMIAICQGAPAYAADVTVKPPAGSGFVIKDSGGTLDRFRVQESGAVLAPSLSSATARNSALCFDNATGQLGPCAAGIVSHEFADFFALMPPDNAATVAPGTDVEFPQDGPVSTGGGITRVGPSAFNLSAIGTYQVMFQVSVTEAGQLILTLNGADLAYTVAGRATGTSQIVGIALVTTTSLNSILTVRNPAGNPTALTITPLAGGTRPSSAHLVITQLQ